MGASMQDTDRRAIGQQIGDALRHLRAACELNLDGAALELIQREARNAISSLGDVVSVKGAKS